MPTDVQFKYELRKHLTELERKLELLRNEEYEKLEKEYLKDEYYGAEEPLVRCGESHLSGLTEPLRSLV